MLSSYVVGTDTAGAEHFRGKLPSIFRIQEWIEHAWDLGINAQGRIETGGVRGTRKYIGTPEASCPCDGLREEAICSHRINMPRQCSSVFRYRKRRQRSSY
jgi:hypothetical protein